MSLQEAGIPMPSVMFSAGGLRSHVRIGDGILSTLPGRIGGRPALAVVDRTVLRRHRAALDAALRDGEGRPLPCLGLTGGEAVKTPEALARLWRRAAAAGLPRDGVLVGIGGGTILDLAGFAAATWQRGVEFLAVPTTLLAAADASVGGKTAVNLDGLKNPVGAFHIAPHVLIDLELLATLPRREWRCGLAEIVKIGIVGAPGLFPGLEAEAMRLRQLFAAGAAGRAVPGAVELPWPSWLTAAVSAKARIVARDYREGGLRKVLNLGHTLAHALEPLHGLPHGEAVALGTAAVTRISRARGLAGPTTVRRIVGLLEACGLPTRCDPPELREAAPFLLRDKKTAGGSVGWVLPARIGRVLTDQTVDPAEALAALRG